MKTSLYHYVNYLFCTYWQCHSGSVTIHCWFQHLLVKILLGVPSSEESSWQRGERSVGLHTGSKAELEMVRLELSNMNSDLNFRILTCL